MWQRVSSYFLGGGVENGGGGDSAWGQSEIRDAAWGLSGYSYAGQRSYTENFQESWSISFAERFRKVSGGLFWRILKTAIVSEPFIKSVILFPWAKTQQFSVLSHHTLQDPCQDFQICSHHLSYSLWIKYWFDLKNSSCFTLSFCLFSLLYHRVNCRTSVGKYKCVEKND